MIDRGAREMAMQMAVSVAGNGEPVAVTLKRAQDFAKFMADSGKPAEPADPDHHIEFSLTNLAGDEISVD